MNVPGSAYQYVIMQNAAVATGAGTPIPITDVDIGAYLSLTVQIAGITSATVTFQGSIDGTNWVAIQFENMNTGDSSTTATVDGLYRGTVLGLMQARANITVYATGTITITGIATA